MNKNRLGQSDLYVSAMGLGCMSLGTDETAAASLIHEALELGVNFLDTADLYDAGRNEELVGAALRGRRGDVILATKVGNRRIPGKEGWVWDPTKAYIKSAVRDSLRRLQTDYIDLYQLHGGTMEDNIEESIEAFEELKQEGVIRYYGISSIRPNVIREYVKRSGIVSVMSQYSLLDRRPEEEVLPLLGEHGISMIARGPLARGLLTEDGKSRLSQAYLDYSVQELAELQDQLAQQTAGSGSGVQAAQQDAGSGSGTQKEQQVAVSGSGTQTAQLDAGSKNGTQAAQLDAGSKNGTQAAQLDAGRRTVTQTALHYPLAQAQVASVIPGASSLRQLRLNAAAAEAAPLSPAELDAVRRISKAGVYTTHR